MNTYDSYYIYILSVFTVKCVLKTKGGVPFSEDFQVKFKSGALKSLLKLGS